VPYDRDPTRVPRVRVATLEGQRRVVAAAAFTPGETILGFEGVLTDRPSRFSVQLEASLHLAPPPGAHGEDADPRHAWVFLNHSCTPNAFRRDRILVAAVAIASGEEITFDYETSEERMTHPFRCACGSVGCTRAWVRGFAYLSREAQARRVSLLPAWLRARYDLVPEDPA
jgi:hypothetical protein